MAQYPWINCWTGTGMTLDQTPITPTFIPVNMGAKLDIKQVMHPREVANGTGGNQTSIVGPAHAEFDGEIMMSPNLTGASPGIPFCGPWLTASGFVQSSPDTITPTYKYTLTVSETNYKYMALALYSGTRSTDALVQRCKNMMFEASIEGKVGEPLRLKMKGMGVADGLPDHEGAYAGTTTLDETVISILKKVAFEIAGGAYKILDFSIMTGHKVQLVTDGSTYGFERGTLVPGPATFKCKVIMENLSSVNPFEDMVGQTIDDFEISFGDNNEGISITSGSSQIDNVETADESGIAVLNITGHFIDNDLAIEFNV